ncbi:MAG: tetratricopeptide repeat protein [Candidatus Eisenbacteria sp.]|nr:tetratricopeptide repeat protein [Candidatus Eisenbacteria bacterium]
MSATEHRGSETLRRGARAGEAQGSRSAPRGPDELVLNGPQEAERVLEQLAAAQPTHADARHRLGLLHLSRGQYASAQQEFEEALGIHPGYRAASYGLRMAHLLQGTLPDEKAAVVADSEAPREEAFWACADDAYRRLHRGEDPLEAFRGTPEAGSVAYHHYAAAFAALRGEDARIGEHLATAGQLSGTSREICADFGWTDAAPQVLANELKGLLWTPLAVDLYAYLGRIYARNGLRAEALASYARAFLVFPDRAQHARHRAEVAIAFGEEEEAIEFLTEAIDADPTCVESRIALGYEYAAQGCADEACLQFEVAAKLAPSYADVRYNLGLLYMAGGRFNEAQGQLRHALSLNPAYLPARRSLVSLLCRTGQAAEALREGRRIMRQGFASADLLVQLGRTALELDAVDQALELLEQAAGAGGDYAPVHYFLGQVYRRKGQKRKAQAAWRKYLARADQWRPLSTGGLPPVGCAVGEMPPAAPIH